MSEDALSQGEVVARLWADERRQRQVQEWRCRCYADVLCLYAHKLAVATNVNPGTMILEARREVQARIREKESLVS